MDLIICFKNLKHSPVIEAKIHEKSTHFEKYLEDATQARWIAGVEDSTPKMYVTEVEINSTDGDFFAKGKSDNLFSSFDEAVRNMEQELRKHKKEWDDHISDEHEVVIRDFERPSDPYPDISWGEFKKAMDRDRGLE